MKTILYFDTYGNITTVMRTDTIDAASIDGQFMCVYENDLEPSDFVLISEYKIVNGELQHVGKPPDTGYFWKNNAFVFDIQYAKSSKWAQVKQARTQAEYAGFTWDGSTFDSDAISQSRITGAVSLAMMSPEFTIGWTLADNTVRTLNQTDMLQVGAALGTHVATQFAKGVVLREQINAATTKEEVEAVVW